MLCEQSLTANSEPSFGGISNTKLGVTGKSRELGSSYHASAQICNRLSGRNVGVNVRIPSGIQSTSSSNYRRLQILQSECLRTVGNLPRRTPIPLLHATFSMPPIRYLIHNTTARFFDASSSHTDPLIQTIGNYTLQDLHLQYKQYIHKMKKYILL
jgi:hypothetical protein